MKRILVIMMLTGISVLGQTGTISSVTTADNTDAAMVNPAGLGVDRGVQVGVGVMLPNLDSSNVTRVNYTVTSNGLSSYAIQGNNGEFSYGFALGADLGSGLYTGVNWYIKNGFDLGLMYRPINKVSLGAVWKFDDTFKTLKTIQTGVAVRPFNYRFTAGADVAFDAANDYSVMNLPLYIQTELADGLDIRAFYDLETSTAGAGMGFSLLSGMSVSATYYDSDGIRSSSIDYRMNTQKKSSILRSGHKQKWIFLNLDGQFIEERPSDVGPLADLASTVNPFGGRSQKYYQLRTFIDHIRELTVDDEVGGIIINIKNVSGGFEKITEIRNALKIYKAAGKKTIVYSEYGMTNSNYFLFSLADEIYMPEQAQVDLRGLMVEMTYFKTLLDTLNIIAEVERISPYKSAMDPFTHTGMSDEVRENWGYLFNDIFNYFTHAIAEGRGWTNEETKTVIDQGPFPGKEALAAGLIDGFMYPDEFKEHIKQLDGEKTKIIPWNKYFSKKYERDWNKSAGKPTIAVIYAVGDIMPGKSVKGSGSSTVMGNETISKAIQMAREDKNVDALVLRIDSGGGSALASDLMWREVLNTTDTEQINKKPFIASMSDVAASGGYYIACQADSIVAGENTITGSIGVIYGRLNISPFLEKIGIGFDRLVYGENADMNAMRLWNSDERTRIHKFMFDTYQTFIEKVADGRETLDTAAVNEVGRGQVWSGGRAKILDLVDEIGGLHDAIAIAKKAAGIDPEAEVNIIEFPRELSPFELMTEKNRVTAQEEWLRKNLPQLADIMTVLPVFINNEPWLIMPYHIEIK